MRSHAREHTRINLYTAAARFADRVFHARVKREQQVRAIRVIARILFGRLTTTTYTYVDARVRLPKTGESRVTRFRRSTTMPRKKRDKKDNLADDLGTRTYSLNTRRAIPRTNSWRRIKNADKYLDRD